MVSYETKIGQTTVRFSTPSSHHATKCPQNSIQRDQIMPTKKECDNFIVHKETSYWSILVPMNGQTLRKVTTYGLFMVLFWSIIYQ